MKTTYQKGEPIRVLTLHQPFASLVAVGAKRNETRTWPNGWRGLVAIHAAARPLMTLEANLCYKEPFSSALEPAGFHQSGTLPLGVVLCVVRFLDCLPASHKSAPGKTTPEFKFGSYTAEHFFFPMTEPLVLKEPIAWKGSQGFKRAPDALEALLFTAMEGAAK